MRCLLPPQWLGEALWLTLAAYGSQRAALHGAFLVVKYLGAAYLLYLAWRMWSAPPRRQRQARRSARAVTGTFLAGLAVTWEPEDHGVLSGAAAEHHRSLAGITPLAWPRAHRHHARDPGRNRPRLHRAPLAPAGCRSPRALRIANRTSATILGGAAVTLATQ